MLCSMESELGADALAQCMAAVAIELPGCLHVPPIHMTTPWTGRWTSRIGSSLPSPACCSPLSLPIGETCAPSSSLWITQCCALPGVLSSGPSAPILLLPEASGSLCAQDEFGLCRCHALLALSTQETPPTHSSEAVPSSELRICACPPGTRWGSKHCHREAENDWQRYAL